MSEQPAPYDITHPPARPWPTLHPTADEDENRIYRNLIDDLRLAILAIPEAEIHDRDLMELETVAEWTAQAARKRLRDNPAERQ